MKKIMFNDKFGLTQAVIDGRKTMTRRIVPESTIRMSIFENEISGGDLAERIKEHTPYCYLETVAISQPYKDVIAYNSSGRNPFSHDFMRYEKGWSNKMFVKAKWMQHQIKITGIRVERLQEINDNDIICEGINIDPLGEGPNIFAFDVYGKHVNRWYFPSAKLAFESLIDKISGKGTWNKNPWVWVYTFELIK